MLNEEMVTILSYFALFLLADDRNIYIGLCINLTIYAHVGLNVIIISLSTLKDIIRKSKKKAAKYGGVKKMIIIKLKGQK